MNHFLLGTYFGERKMLVKAVTLRKAKAIYKKWYNSKVMTRSKILSANIKSFTLEDIKE